MSYEVPSLLKCYDFLRWGGEGYAVFSDPPGKVSGPAKIYLSNTGELTISIQAKIFDCPGIDEVDAIEFFGDMGTRQAKRFEAYPNRCVAAGISNELLNFSGDGKSLVYSVGYKWNPDEQVITIDVHVLRGELAPLKPSPKAAHHIAIPLHNYNGPYHESAHELGDHALSWWSKPLLNITTTGEQGQVTNNNDLFQRVTRFSGKTHSGFIQPWPNFEPDPTGSAPMLGPTAMMVIDKVLTEHSHDDLFKLVPSALYYGMSLASGMPIGSALFILFDESHSILKIYYAFMYLQHGLPLYSPFGIGCENHTGLLIDAILKSDLQEKTFVNVAMAALLKSGLPNISTDDRIYFVSRSIEALGKEFIGSKNISRDFPESTLNTFTAQVTALEDLVESSPMDGGHKDKVKASLKSLLTIHPSFIDVVTGLLRMFNFPDDKILECIPKWKSEMNRARGRAVHGGAARPDGDDPFWEMRLLHHMQDIATRVLLTAFQYTGTYRPPTVKYECALPVNRLKADSPVTWLGYDIENQQPGVHRSPVERQ